MKKDENVKPDEISFNTIIKGCALTRKLDLGDKILREMKEFNLIPNDISYNSMIDIAVRVDNLKKAWE